MFYLSALLKANWSLSVRNTTMSSLLIHWQDLTPLINKRVVHYITLIRNKNGGDVSNTTVVNGNTTQANITRLSSYTEYKVSVIGVSIDGQPYTSSNVTVWTKEGGTAFYRFLFYNNQTKEISL